MKPELRLLALTAVCLAAFTSCGKSDQAGPANSAAGTNGVLLKVKWPLGARYVFRMDLDQHSASRIPGMPQPIKQDAIMALTYALSAVKETPGGGRELEVEFLASELEVKTGTQVVLSFDSKESSKNDDQNPIIAPYRKMIGSTLRMEVDAEGKVERVLGVQEWIDNLSKDAGPAKGMIAQQFNEAYFRQMADFGRGMPRQPVQPRQMWPFSMEMSLGPMGKLKVDSKITFTGWEEREQHRCAVLKTTASLKGTPSRDTDAVMGPMGKMSFNDGKASGTSYFDPELGAVIESISEQSLHLKGQAPTPPGGKSPMDFASDISQTVTLKLVEAGKVRP
jgi:hypothetical protein